MKTLFQILAFSFIPVFAICQQGFLENKGQWNSEALFKLENGPTAMFIDKQGYTVLIKNAADYENSRNRLHHHTSNQSGRTQEDTLRYHVYKVKFVGADFSRTPVKENPLSGYENFFLGNNPAHWASECKTYQTITFKNIYNKIDLVYYTNNLQIKYDLIVNPGGNVNDIQLEYNGATSLELSNNNLVVKTSVGDVVEMKPFTYQQNNQQKQPVASAYKLNGNNVSFAVNDYNRSQPLIIDPSLIFSSYTGTTTVVWGYTATYAANGAMYAAGITAATGFPVSQGAFQQTGGGGSNNIPPDIGIIKLSPDGSTRIYATYLGGSGLDVPHSLLEDTNGNLVIMGRTNSTNFPVNNQFGTLGGYDIFVSKLNAAGSALTGSLRIGGTGNDGLNITDNVATGPLSLNRNYGDDSKSDMIFDANNNIIITGCTQSNNFFIKNGFQLNSGGMQDGIVIKVNDAVNDIIWSTYFGGNGDDGAFNIAKHTGGILYISGGTASTNLPGVLPGAIQTGNAGGLADGFCSRLSDNGSSVSLSVTTFFGTSQIDIIYGLQTDADGDVYITGTSMGILNGVNAIYNSPNARQFIAKLLPNLSGLYYRTNFGTSNSSAPNIVPIAFFVDQCENVYVSGWGGNANNLTSNPFPSSGTANMFVSPNALQSQTDGSDFYVFVLQKDAIAPLYGSYFGQIGGAGSWDHAHSTSRFSNNGTLYLATCANCKSVATGQALVSGYPITPGAFATINNATTIGSCDLGLVKMNLDFTTSCNTTSVLDVLQGNKKERLIASPNPNKGFFKLSYYHTQNGVTNTLRIMDMSGKKVFERSFKTTGNLNEFQLQLPVLNHGVYIAEVINVNGNRTASCKFLVNE